MVDVGGKPLLEHQVLLARKYGIRDILILTGFGAEHIKQHFGDGAAWGVSISYQHEEQPLGTAGSLLNAFERLQDVFVMMYGDTLLNVDLRRMLAFHDTCVSATLFLHPNDHPQDSDLVELNSENQVQALHSYPHAPGQYFQNLVNAALYVISKRALTDVWQQWRQNLKALDVCRDLFPKLLAQGEILQGYRSREYIKDAGTPVRLQKVRRHYESGRVQAGSLETALPAVFLDRDGTLNYDHGWINDPEKISLLPGAADAIKAINDSGCLAVVVTNQPVIARGECSEARMQQIHNRLDWLLGEAHAYIDALYYCPHHPHSGFPLERRDLKIACDCRKPGTALLETAKQELNINLNRSWMIGDSDSDIRAATKFGIPAVLVNRNQGPNSEDHYSEPRLRSRTVSEAVNAVLNEQFSLQPRPVVAQSQ